MIGKVPSGILGYENLEDFKVWLLSKTQIISSEEIDQFQREMEEYLHQVKQTILRTDGQSIKLKHSIIRTDRSPSFIEGHRHGAVREGIYLIANIAPVGWNTYYMRGRQKILSRLGHTTILSELERIKAEQTYRNSFRSGNAAFSWHPSRSMEKAFYSQRF